MKASTSMNHFGGYWALRSDGGYPQTSEEITNGLKKYYQAKDWPLAWCTILKAMDSRNLDASYNLHQMGLVMVLYD